MLHRPENVNSLVTKLNVCIPSEDRLNSTDTTNQIKNGFRKCELFPLNPDNVDLSKCVKNILQKPELEEGSSALKLADL